MNELNDLEVLVGKLDNETMQEMGASFDLVKKAVGTQIHYAFKLVGVDMDMQCNFINGKLHTKLDEIDEDDLEEWGNVIMSSFVLLTTFQIPATDVYGEFQEHIELLFVHFLDDEAVQAIRSIGADLN
ncbi:hypothetical protein ACQU0X_25800 [Pseudovibrio ascidiaceicola]|uniref:hypothetical protein n=1 Tax=Pseudovibrio ascidiaceicola TaxID=285279 RepID=UPI003D36F096